MPITIDQANALQIRPSMVVNCSMALDSDVSLECISSVSKVEHDITHRYPRQIKDAEETRALNRALEALYCATRTGALARQNRVLARVEYFEFTAREKLTRSQSERQAREWFELIRQAPLLGS